MTIGSDIEQVVATKYKYAYGIDTKDWELYRSIFTDEIVMDFSSYSGAPARKQSAEEWVAGCQMLFTALDSSQHQMSNPLVEVHGDKARIRMYMQAEHFLMNRLGDASFTLGGWYDDHLIRNGKEWKISAVTLNVLWSRGNRHIMQLAVEKR